MKTDLKANNYVMPFGKYKGKSLGEILSIQPSYLIWLHWNTKIQITDLLMTSAMFKADQQNLSDDNPVNYYFSHDIYECGDR